MKQTESLTPNNYFKFDPLFFVTGHPQYLVMCVHHCPFPIVSVSCWPSWVYRSCEHLLLSVLRHCVLLLQSYGPALVQSLGDPAGHWTNSGALLHWFRPPQTLPIAGALWQPDDEHSAKFRSRSSSGKLATQHWVDQHTGNEPKRRRKTEIHNKYNIYPIFIKAITGIYQLLFRFTNQKKKQPFLF